MSAHLAVSYSQWLGAKSAASLGEKSLTTSWTTVGPRFGMNGPPSSTTHVSSVFRLPEPTSSGSEKLDRVVCRDSSRRRSLERILLGVQPFDPAQAPFFPL